MFSFKRSFKRRWIKYYSKSNWPIVVDIASVFTVFALLVLFLSLYLYNPEILLSPKFFNNKTEEKPEDRYVLDLDNPPLISSFYFLDNFLDNNSKSSILKIELKNNSKQEIKDLKIRINTTNNNLEIANLELLEPNDKLIISNNNEVSIKSLGPNLNKELSLMVNWSKLNISGKAVDLKIDSQYLVTSQEVKKTSFIKSPRAESSLLLKSMIFYTSPEGDKLGLGPIPPIANLPTNYWLFWEVEVEGEVENFIMSARLPLGVNLTERYSILDGDFSYDKENRLITWKIKEIKTETDSLRIGLEIQLIPNESQVGQILNLIEKVEYLAKDSISGRQINKQLNNINTNLPDDKFNKDLGEIKSFNEY